MSGKVKTLIVVLSALVLSACAAPRLTQEQDSVRSVSNTDNCEFVTSAYMESRPQVLQHYLKIQTHRRGGNAYKLVSTSNTVVMGSATVMANYEVYNCPH